MGFPDVVAMYFCVAYFFPPPPKLALVLQCSVPWVRTHKKILKTSTSFLKPRVANDQSKIAKKNNSKQKIKKKKNKQLKKREQKHIDHEKKLFLG